MFLSHKLQIYNRCGFHSKQSNIIYFLSFDMKLTDSIARARTALHIIRRLHDVFTINNTVIGL